MPTNGNKSQIESKHISTDFANSSTASHTTHVLIGLKISEEISTNRNASVRIYSRQYFTYQLLTKKEEKNDELIAKSNESEIYLVKLLDQYLEPIAFFALRTGKGAAKKKSID